MFVIFVLADFVSSNADCCYHRQELCDRLFALQLQFAKVAKPHLCIVERNSPTPLCRQFSLTQESLGRVIPSGERPAEGINVWRQKVFFCRSVFYLRYDPPTKL